MIRWHTFCCCFWCWVISRLLFFCFCFEMDEAGDAVESGERVCGGSCGKYHVLRYLPAISRFFFFFWSRRVHRDRVLGRKLDLMPYLRYSSMVQPVFCHRKYVVQQYIEGTFLFLIFICQGGLSRPCPSTGRVRCGEDRPGRHSSRGT